MPTVPKNQTLTANSAQVLNVIRAGASPEYRARVTEATYDLESIRGVGNVIMNFPGLQNEFISALINRIGLVLVTSKIYRNPWYVFKKGTLELGETVEEIFIDLIKPHDFDAVVAESEVDKQAIPDVYSAFHTMNFQKFYKVTVSEARVRAAFLSLTGVVDFTQRLIMKMYTSMNYDEFQVMKYLLAKSLINGMIKPTVIPTVDSTNIKQIASIIKGASNSIEFMTTDYNFAGVTTCAEKNDQYLISSATFDANIDVEVLASAFNLNYAEFMGHRILVDSFGKLDIERLNLLLGSNPGYKEIGEDVLKELDKIPAVLVDRDFFVVIDNLLRNKTRENEQSLSNNWWLHSWKTFSISTFANATVFVPGTPSVTSVTVSPQAVTVAKGKTTQLTATVEVTDFAPKTVIWSSDSEGVTVNKTGLVSISADVQVASAIITAVSTFDTSKKAQCTLTIN